MPRDRIIKQKALQFLPHIWGQKLQRFSIVPAKSLWPKNTPPRVQRTYRGLDLSQLFRVKIGDRWHWPTDARRYLLLTFWEAWISLGRMIATRAGITQTFEDYLNPDLPPRSTVIVQGPPEGRLRDAPRMRTTTTTPPEMDQNGVWWVEVIGIHGKVPLNTLERVRGHTREIITFDNTPRRNAQPQP